MFAATVIKELQLLRRDPRALVRLIMLPVAFIALFGMVFKNGQQRPPSGHPLAIFVDPASPIRTPLMAAFEHSKVFKPLEAPTADDVRARVADESFDVGLIVPAGFDPAHGGAKAELVIDTDKPLAERGPVQGAVIAIVDAAVMGPRVDTVAIVSPRMGKPTEQPSSFQLTVPGNAVLFGFFIALTCALSFAEERRTGTWRRLLAAPVSRWTLLVAKLVPYVVLGTIQVTSLFAIGAFFFGMKIEGSVPALAVLSLGVAACATGLGLVLAAFSTTEKQISSLGSVVILIMGLVSGCMLPRALMPHVLQQIGLFVPHGWALDGYYALLVRHGTGFADVIKPIGAVYAFAALFIFIGVRRYRFDS